MLLLIALLALFVAWLIGTCLENTNQQRRYQANTERRRRVLSVIYLGRRAINDSRLQFNDEQLKLATEHRQTLVQNAFINEWFVGILQNLTPLVESIC